MRAKKSLKATLLIASAACLLGMGGCLAAAAGAGAGYVAGHEASDGD